MIWFLNSLLLHTKTETGDSVDKLLLASEAAYAGSVLITHSNSVCQHFLLTRVGRGAPMTTLTRLSELLPTVCKKRARLEGRALSSSTGKRLMINGAVVGLYASVKNAIYQAAILSLRGQKFFEEYASNLEYSAVNGERPEACA